MESLEDAHRRYEEIVRIEKRDKRNRDERERYGQGEFDRSRSKEDAKVRNYDPAKGAIICPTKRPHDY